MAICLMEEMVHSAARRQRQRQRPLVASELVVELEQICALQRLAAADPQLWESARRRVGAAAGCWLLQVALAVASKISFRSGCEVLSALPDLPGAKDRHAYFRAVCDPLPFELLGVA